MTQAAGAALRLRAAAEAIWTRSRETTAARLDTLERAAAAALDGALDEALRAEAEREAHRLAGTVGSFGFAEGSRLARAIEDALGDAARGVPVDAFHLAEHALALRGELERPIAAVAGLPTPIPAEAPAGAPSGGPMGRDAVAAPAGGAALLGSGDPVRAGLLVAEAARRGVQLAVAPTPEQARAQLAAGGPTVLVVDCSADSPDPGWLTLVGEASGARPPTPVVAIVQGGAIAPRLEAMRRGAERVIPAGTRAPELVHEVALLHARAAGLRARVLAVDDDPGVRSLVGAVLGAQGAAVTTLADPLRLLDVLDETDPELLLLDVDMPGADGLELCRVVRGDPRWARLPVVFLTARRDADTIARIVDAGGDDFVQKPIAGPELVARVANRLDRARRLGGRAEIDPETGLPSRVAAQAELDRYGRLARRHARPLSVALVAVDQLAATARRHGRDAAAAAVCHAARALRAGVRAEDVVGRWDDETFVVGLYDAPHAEAARRIATVLAALAQPEPQAAGAPRPGVACVAGVAAVVDGSAGLAPALREAAASLRPSAASAAGQTVDARRVDVAVVEDDDTLAMLLVHALDARGLTVRRVSDGQQAVDLLGGADPRLAARVVLLDVNLPALDGISVLRRLAADGVTDSTRVVMLTARSAEAETLETLDLGAFDHVAKPFSIPILLRRVDRALGA